MTIKKGQQVKFLSDFHFEKTLKETGLKQYLDEIMADGRHPRQIKNRYILSKHLHDKGFSYNQIGKRINRHHTSVSDLINRWGPRNGYN